MNLRRRRFRIAAMPDPDQLELCEEDDESDEELAPVADPSAREPWELPIELVGVPFS
jgi:hypothetical protein